MAKRKATEGITAVIESPVQQPVKSKEPKLCQCGCGGTTQSKFVPGHDATLKSILLGRLDEGDADAGTELVNRGWYTQERLDARQLKREDAAVARAAKEAVKAEKADARKAKAKGGAKAPARNLDELVEGGVAAAVAAIGGGDEGV